MGEQILIFLGCLAIAALIAGVTMYLVRRNLKSVRFERTASNYTRENSFKLTNKSDTFLYKRITRVAIPRNNSSGGGGVGGVKMGGGGMKMGGGMKSMKR